MKMKTLSAACLLAMSGAVMAEFSANVALTTNYMFRGISQNDNEPAIQGGFDYAHDSGFYAGVWASNVDSTFFSGSTIELDTYLGWSGDVGPVSVDAGYLRYNYPGTTFDDNNTDEFHVGVSKDFGVAAVGFTANYSPDFFGTGDAMYYDLGVEVPVGSVTVAAHYGATEVDEDAAVVGAGVSADYQDYSLGVSTEYAGFGFDLTFTDTSDESATAWNCASGNALCGEKLVFTVSKDI